MLGEASEYQSAKSIMNHSGNAPEVHIVDSDCEFRQSTKILLTGFA